MPEAKTEYLLKVVEIGRVEGPKSNGGSFIEAKSAHEHLRMTGISDYIARRLASQLYKNILITITMEE